MTDHPPAPDLGTDVEPVCPRHPQTVAYVRCQRCGRPTCPSCQRPAAVGIQCVDCVAEGARAARQGTTVFGGRVTDGRPLVTWAVIALCLVVWVGEILSPAVFQAVAFAPFLGESEPWRFLTSAFAHSPTMVLHIAFNMYALYLLGGYLEPLLGRARYLATYLLSALGGSVAYLLLAAPPVNPNDPADSPAWYGGVVGASGAVFGLFGVYLVLNRVLNRSSTGMYATLAVNFALGLFFPGIAWQAHVGGFVTGLACAGLIALLRTREARPRQWLALGGVLAVLVALAVLKYALV